MKGSNRGPHSREVDLDLPETAKMLHVAFSPPALDLTKPGSRARLNLTMPKSPAVDSAILAVDAYALGNPVHPHGHFGWWTFALEADQETSFSVSAKDGGLSVESRSTPLLNCWVNDVLAQVSADASILLHLVLRHRINNSILSQQSLVAYRSRSALAEGRKAASALAPPAAANTLVLNHGFNWPLAATVHVVAKSLPKVTEIAGLPSAVMTARQLAREGVPYRLYATDFDPRLRDAVGSTRELLDTVKPSDIVVVLFDDYEPNLPWLRGLKCRKGFIHLGLPSSVRLQAFDAEAHHNYGLALAQVGTVRDFELLAAPSQAAGAELAAALRAAGEASATGEEPPEDVAIMVSPLVDRLELWRQIEAEELPLAASPLLVCPARLEPGNDFLSTLKVFEKVVELHPQATLIAASTHAREVYFQYVNYMLSTRFAAIRQQVHLWTNSSDGRLKALLQNCDGLIQMGALSDEYSQDAAIFGKPLFISGGVAPSGEHARGTLRLYGAPEEQAAAILDVLARAGQRGVSGQEAAPGGAEQGRGLWRLLERLIALPLPLD